MSGDSLQLTHIPPVRVGMLVRRPPEVVFQALVDPAVTTRFWFTKSTGALVPGVEVQWDWERLAERVADAAFEPFSRSEARVP